MSLDDPNPREFAQLRAHIARELLVEFDRNHNRKHWSTSPAL
jgi:hypothetical protein